MVPFPQGRSLLYPLYRKLYGPQSRSGRCGRAAEIFQVGNRNYAISIPNRFINWAISARCQEVPSSNIRRNTDNSIRGSSSFLSVPSCNFFDTNLNSATTGSMEITECLACNLCIHERETRNDGKISTLTEVYLYAKPVLRYTGTNVSMGDATSIFIVVGEVRTQENLKYQIYR
jgi:hypothetical protein